MSYPINYPTPQGANVQIFSEAGTTSDWVKPQGASFVWFTLIGGGGNGTASLGGGSSAVTNFMGPAFLIPDVLRVSVASGNTTNSTIIYQAKDGTGYTLLTALGSAGSSEGQPTASNNFSAMGFYQNIVGQPSSTGSTSASATTFLSAGAGNTGTSVTANYGYSLGSGNRSGFFMTQPIIVGVGGIGTGKGGVGCGGGTTGVGGPGLVVIITW